MDRTTPIIEVLLGGEMMNVALTILGGINVILGGVLLYKKDIKGLTGVSVGIMALMLGMNLI